MIGCAEVETPLSEAEIVSVAAEHVSRSFPDLDVSQRPPLTTYFEDAKAWGGGPLWVVGFAVPAPKNEDGKIQGVRPFWTLSVWVRPDGTVLNSAAHTP